MVHVTPAPLAGAVRVSIEAPNDDARGGSLYIAEESLRHLPAAIEAALEVYDATRLLSRGR
ncbi:MAG: hypothetical protein WD771_08800 [Gemmatimonadaceae bacterium]